MRIKRSAEYGDNKLRNARNEPDVCEGRCRNLPDSSVLGIVGTRCPFTKMLIVK